MYNDFARHTTREQVLNLIRAVKNCDWERMPMHFEDDEQLTVYVCKLCNYVHESEDMVQRHILHQHNANAFADGNYTKLRLF